MMTMNLSQALYQLILLFILSNDLQIVKDLCNGANFQGKYDCKADTEWDGDTCNYRQNTLVFNVFVFCQFWNEINCRKLKDLNVFERFFDSYMFSFVLIFTFILQFFMVELGGADFVGTNGLNIKQWILSVVLGMGALPVGFLARLIPIKQWEERFDYGKDVGDPEEEDEEDDAEVEMKEDVAVPVGTPSSPSETTNNTGSASGQFFPPPIVHAAEREPGMCSPFAASGRLC